MWLTAVSSPHLIFDFVVYLKHVAISPQKLTNEKPTDLLMQSLLQAASSIRFP